MLKFKEIVEKEYGSKKMKLQNLWCLFLVAPLLLTNLLIKKTCMVLSLILF